MAHPVRAYKARAYTPRAYTDRFLVPNQVSVHVNPNPATGDAAPNFSGQSIQARCMGNAIYLIPWQNISSSAHGYMYNYDLTTKTFSSYTSIPDCSVTWWLDIVGTDMYVASKSIPANLPAYFKSSDGGSTWSTVTFAEPSTAIGVIRAMKFNPFNSMNGIVFGIEGSSLNNAWYARTTDGGTTWSSWTQLTTIRGVYDISYIDANTIVICGTNSSNVGITRKSTDGGATWGSNVTLSGTAICSSMSWLDSKVGYAAARTNSSVVGGAGRLYITTDGGSSWTLLSTLPTSMKSATNVFAFSRSLIVVNGYNTTTGVMNVSRDGGLTWTQITTSVGFSTWYIIQKDHSLFTGSNGRTLVELRVSG